MRYAKRWARTLAVAALPIFLVSLLWSQDLTEAAKKEKARREAAKTKKVTVVTNSDLGSVRKRPSVDVTNPDLPADAETGQAGEAPPADTVGAAETDVDRSGAADAGTPPQIMPEVNTAPQATATPVQNTESQQAALEANWLKAKEYADLLEIKINGLWQEFYSMDDMMPKDQIQQQISDTFDKYQKAREDEAKAKEELDKFLGIR
jgi:hypothetical protein